MSWNSLSIGVGTSEGSGAEPYKFISSSCVRARMTARSKLALTLFYFCVSSSRTRRLETIIRCVVAKIIFVHNEKGMLEFALSGIIFNYRDVLLLARF